MQCGFAAAGVGHRPENTDKETTSLETPSLPTSDGVKRPVRFPETGSKTSNPRSRTLDRSVSASSVGSPGSGQAETVNCRDVKSEDSFPERPATLKKEELSPAPPIFPDPVASANVRAPPAGENGTESHRTPIIPSQTTSEQPAACFGPQKSDTEKETLNPEPPIKGGGSSLSNPQANKWAVPFAPEPVHELHGDLQLCGTPSSELFQEKDHSPPNAEEPLCPDSASPLLADADLSLSEGRRGLEGEMGPGDAIMEVDTAEEFAVATGDPSDEAIVSLTDTECSVMEVELSKHASSSPACLHPPLTKDLPPPGSAGSESAAASGGQVEDPCLSLTSALKELHQLLVVSSQRDFALSQQEDSLLSAAVPEPRAAEDEASPEAHERTCPDSQDDAGLSFSEHVSVEVSFESGRESIEVQETHTSAGSCGQDVLTVQESSASSSSSFLSSSTTLEQRRRGQRCTSSCPKESHLPSSLLEAQDTTQSTRNSFLEEPGAPKTSNPGLQSPPDGLSELLPSPLAACLDPPAAADIDQIVGAGFTPQEAREALEHAGGNADLALLILLAKNIVVPT